MDIRQARDSKWFKAFIIALMTVFGLYAVMLVLDLDHDGIAFGVMIWVLFAVAAVAFVGLVGFSIQAIDTWPSKDPSRKK